jgi:hypothetical protein
MICSDRHRLADATLPVMIAFLGRAVAARPYLGLSAT